jgi:polysaccharide deacetylase 2 family uncharacterized protein YibQ
VQTFFKHVFNRRRISALFLAVLLQGAVQAGELALVIDDLGHNKQRGERAIELPGAITVAVLPFAPYTHALAEHAVAHDKDVIVHQPMEPYPAPHVRNEHGTLTLGMPPPEFNGRISAALDAVPSRVGVSNHTGSLLTQHRLPMQRLMQAIDQRGLFFLDSRTTAETVALKVAVEHGVPALKRDVFLDHERTTTAIHGAFEKALQVARRNGHAVVIGHPYGITLDYLERRLRTLPNDITLVKAAELAQRQQRASHPAVLAQPPGLRSLHISPGR